jgi:ABC-type hemin transport system substrate-binding protein
MYPKRIVCLTEEPTEVLYALGEDSRIVGNSGFTVRPPRARREKPKVSAFLSAKVDHIIALKPDLAIGTRRQVRARSPHASEGKRFRIFGVWELVNRGPV